MPNPAPSTMTFVYLSPTDLELCDAIRRLEAKRAALEPQDPGWDEITRELNILRQDLTVSDGAKARRAHD